MPGKTLLPAALALFLAACLLPATAGEIKAGDLTLTVPETWEAQAPSSRMRLAQVAIPGNAELAVFFFGAGGGGGVEANIARWVGQFAEEGRAVERIEGTSPHGDFVQVTITGTYNAPVGPPMLRKSEARPGSRVIGIVLHTPNGDYFLKCAGPDAAVNAAAPDLLKAFGGRQR